MFIIISVMGSSMNEIETYYSLVSDLMTKENFLNEIRKRRKKYGNLLTDEAIAYLVVDELGRNPGNKMKIGDLYDGIHATVEAEISKINPVEIVEGKGKKHKILKVNVKDETGECQLVLWNDEIDKLGLNLHEGAKVKIINGYVRENIYGLQISLGKWGLLILI